MQFFVILLPKAFFVQPRTPIFIIPPIATSIVLPHMQVSAILLERFFLVQQLQMQFFIPRQFWPVQLQQPFLLDTQLQLLLLQRFLIVPLLAEL